MNPPEGERRRVLQNLIMLAVADDYEDLEMILSTVCKWCMEDGHTFAVEQSDILSGLTVLMDEGLVGAYCLRATSSAVPDYELTRSSGVIEVPNGDSERGWCYFTLTSAGQRKLAELDIMRN